MKSHLHALVLVVAALAATGCAQTFHDYEAFVTRPMPVVTGEDYGLAPPDVIMITSSRVPEIKEFRETVHPDGKIRLPLLGTHFVAGKTLETVREELTKEAQRFYKGAEVSVRGVNFRSKKIYVFGHVRRRGPLVYDGANTVLETIAVADPTDLADIERIRVIRPSLNPEIEPKRMTVNLKDMGHMGILTNEAVLQEGDIIYVPPTPLAKVGLTFQQLLLPLQPAASTISAPAQITTGVGSVGGGP
ncbi:MAG: polysaccharide biosynthesis/export family protein [Phycisphaeraceae bacterium]|nr:polysaccharide biosynthesis/export family protein [Phycisphaeraceae bacterium]